MKKNQWLVSISLMNGNQQHYHFTITPEELDLIRDAALEAIRGKMLPDGIVSDLEEPLDKMLFLSDKYWGVKA